jgi:hypothetical protein
MNTRYLSRVTPAKLEPALKEGELTHGPAVAPAWAAGGTGVTSGCNEALSAPPPGHHTEHHPTAELARIRSELPKFTSTATYQSLVDKYLLFM